MNTPQDSTADTRYEQDEVLVFRNEYDIEVDDKRREYYHTPLLKPDGSDSPDDPDDIRDSANHAFAHMLAYALTEAGKYIARDKTAHDLAGLEIELSVKFTGPHGTYAPFYLHRLPDAATVTMHTDGAAVIRAARGQEGVDEYRRHDQELDERMTNATNPLADLMSMLEAQGVSVIEFGDDN